MNNVSTQIIKRQILIIQFLLANNYVSTLNIQNHLKEKDFDIPLRTLQRDLTTLSDILPIECRKEDKPYSWRWQRLPNTSQHGLSMSQALALRIVETELKGVIPKDLYERLNPLFIKAQFIRGLSEIETYSWQNDSPNTHQANFMKPNHIVPVSPTQSIISLLKSLSRQPKKLLPNNPFKTNNDNTIENFMRHNQAILENLEDLESANETINDLVKELNKKQLGFLADLLKTDLAEKSFLI